MRELADGHLARSAGGQKRSGTSGTGLMASRWGAEKAGVQSTAALLQRAPHMCAGRACAQHT